MEQTRTDIEAVVRRMADRYAAKDPDGVLVLFADDEPMVVGTGADEVRFGLAEIRTQVERDLVHADSISMAFEDLSVKVVGDAASALADAAFAGSVGGEDFRLPVRLTVGLVKSGTDGSVMRRSHIRG